jgi:hypothetical protein
MTVSTSSKPCSSRCCSTVSCTMPSQYLRTTL